MTSSSLFLLPPIVFPSFVAFPHFDIPLCKAKIPYSNQMRYYFLIEFNLFNQDNITMSSPLDNWEMKLVGRLFGKQSIIQLENVKFLYKTQSKNKQLDTIREKYKETIAWNFVFGMGATWLLVFGLQKLIPSYGSKISLANIIIDGGIFTMAVGVSGFYSVRQMEPEIQPLRKKWITQHNLEYLKSMRFMSKHYEIPLLEQIKGYVKTEEQTNWKLKYDSLML